MYKKDTTEELKCVIRTIYPFLLCQSSSDSDVRASVTHSEDPCWNLLFMFMILNSSSITRFFPPWYKCCVLTCPLFLVSLVPHLCVPSGKKRSGEWSQISWAYYPNRVTTNEITRSIIIAWHFPYNSNICSSPFKYPYLFLAGWLQNVLIVARLHCRKSVH